MKNTATFQVTTAPDFRALCAGIVDALDSGITAGRIRMSPLADRARAALAEPVAKEPTVMELVEISTEIEEQGLGQIDFARAVLARWGQR
jgi:hypothetical protein